MLQNLDPLPLRIGTTDTFLPRSLRWRLVLWYGLLMIVALSIFAILVFVLARDTLYRSTYDTLQANSRYALSTVEGILDVYGTDEWIQELSFASVDLYRDPGLEIAVYDTHGKLVYTLLPTHLNQLMKLPDGYTEKLKIGEIPPPFEGQVQGVHAMLQVMPIEAPVSVLSGLRTDAVPIIGTLVVIQSLSAVDKTFLILQTLLLLSGLTALIGALVCSWLISVNVLRPLSELVKTAQTITLATRGTHIANLHQRVPRPHGGQDEMVQVVDTFNDMLSALEKTSQAQHRFIADASHELRAPLTTIQGNLAFLESHMDDLPAEEQKTMLSDAHDETIRLARLVDGLLLLARADACSTSQSTALLTQELPVAEKKTASLAAYVELDRLILHLVRQLRGRMSLDGANVSLEIGHIEPIRVPGCEESIRRVLLILLDNALKYTAACHSDGTGCVNVSVEHRGKYVIIRVQDNGIGIPEQDLPHIFERFYRADQARSRVGTGLGLSIAQTLVAQLGGQISAESTSGQGSLFVMCLPTIEKS
ncbi:MAG TPA: HAMP domain-containing sensor histidine kinase [Ktedonobacteraceae bacterium]|nr:HAMP domain-containing sensor histidine kinase [Ktedonobacteraceae bacterium]